MIPELAFARAGSMRAATVDAVCLVWTLCNSLRGGRNGRVGIGIAFTATGYLPVFFGLMRAVAVWADDRSLQSLMNRVDTAIQHIKDLRPATFDLATLDDELASMALIRALPDEFSTFALSLLLQDKLEKTTIHQAFVTEESQRRHRASEAPNVASALAATSQPSPSSSPIKCAFCGINNHQQDSCTRFLRAQKEAQENVRSNRKGRKANKAQEQDTEYAGNASALRSTSNSNNTDFDWLADTGATSHMTSHRQWLRNYSPLCVPIRLADHTIVYSAGVGTVVIHPVVDGIEACSVELTRVLDVPQLRNNLLACLYLTKRKGIRMEVDADTMHFKCKGTTLFQATVTSQNTGILNAVTEPLEHANATSSTLPMDISLWHQRFCHHSIPNVQKLIKDDLVIGLIITSDSKPDPICEPCLAGKMVSNPFPSSSRISSSPLELIHSDLHGPLPVQSPEGYRYWITFIDDCTRLKAVMFLKRNSP